MQRAGAYQLDRAAIEKLTNAAFTFEGGGGGCARAHVKKDLVGKDVAVLASAAGVRVPAGTNLLFGETDENHAFVVEEQMMPFVRWCASAMWMRALPPRSKPSMATGTPPSCIRRMLRA